MMRSNRPAFLSYFFKLQDETGFGGPVVTFGETLTPFAKKSAELAACKKASEQMLYSLFLFFIHV